MFSSGIASFLAANSSSGNEGRSFNSNLGGGVGTMRTSSLLHVNGGGTNGTIPGVGSGSLSSPTATRRSPLINPQQLVGGGAGDGLERLLQTTSLTEAMIARSLATPQAVQRALQPTTPDSTAELIAKLLLNQSASSQAVSAPTPASPPPTSPNLHQNLRSLLSLQPTTRGTSSVTDSSSTTTTSAASAAAPPNATTTTTDPSQQQQQQQQRTLLDNLPLEAILASPELRRQALVMNCIPSPPPPPPRGGGGGDGGGTLQAAAAGASAPPSLATIATALAERQSALDGVENLLKSLQQQQLQPHPNVASQLAAAAGVTGGRHPTSTTAAAAAASSPTDPRSAAFLSALTGTTTSEAAPKVGSPSLVQDHNANIAYAAISSMVKQQTASLRHANDAMGVARKQQQSNPIQKQEIHQTQNTTTAAAAATSNQNDASSPPIGELIRKQKRVRVEDHHHSTNGREATKKEQQQSHQKKKKETQNKKRTYQGDSSSKKNNKKMKASFPVADFIRQQTIVGHGYIHHCPGTKTQQHKGHAKKETQNKKRNYQGHATKNNQNTKASSCPIAEFIRQATRDGYGVVHRPKVTTTGSQEGKKHDEKKPPSTAKMITKKKKTIQKGHRSSVEDATNDPLNILSRAAATLSTTATAADEEKKQAAQKRFPRGEFRGLSIRNPAEKLFLPVSLGKFQKKWDALEKSVSKYKHIRTKAEKDEFVRELFARSLSKSL